jgi:nicotinamidase-related amidase
MTLSPTPENSIVLLIDWQERLVSAMPEAIEAAHRAKAGILLRAATAAGVPVLVTEQYPKGLGHTVESLRTALNERPAPVPVIEKRDFAATDVAEFNERLEESGRSHVVVLGMEAHICVWQTVRALAARGLAVHVPRDAVISRRTNDYLAALSLYERAGATVTSVETVAFDWVRRAEGDLFKAISRLVR